MVTEYTAVDAYVDTQKGCTCPHYSRKTDSFCGWHLLHIPVTAFPCFQLMGTMPQQLSVTSSGRGSAINEGFGN